MNYRSYSNKCHPNGISDTWVENEERRRIWWACLVLDRYVHVTMRFRLLFYPNIEHDELLPAADNLVSGTREEMKVVEKILISR